MDPPRAGVNEDCAQAQCTLTTRAHDADAHARTGSEEARVTPPSSTKYPDCLLLPGCLPQRPAGPWALGTAARRQAGACPTHLVVLAVQDEVQHDEVMAVPGGLHVEQEAVDEVLQQAPEEHPHHEEAREGGLRQGHRVLCRAAGERGAASGQGAAMAGGSRSPVPSRVTAPSPGERPPSIRQLGGRATFEGALGSKWAVRPEDLCWAGLAGAVLWERWRCPPRV